jgi:hypothetical protein
LTSADARAGVSGSITFEVTGAPVVLTVNAGGANIPFTRANGGATTFAALTGPEEFRVDLFPGGPGSVTLPFNGTYSVSINAGARSNPGSPILTDPTDPSTLVTTNVPIVNAYSVSISVQ